MNITSSPGFDTITPTFIKCTYKRPQRVPKRHGRGSENVNVMAPRPHCCSLQPAHKKGSHSQVLERGQADCYLFFHNESRKLRNDRSEWHAVQTVWQSVALYCSRLAWSTRVIHHTIGFYPGRSTLQPLFILQHLKDAAQKMQRGSLRLYTAFIDFKQAYD